VGGGYASDIVENIIEFAAATSATTWAVTAVNDGPFSGTIQAQAFCLGGPGLSTTTATNSYFTRGTGQILRREVATE
jgi:hypothetical protein